MIRPCVVSRLARIRAASTSRPSAISTMAASPPEVTSSRFGSVGHSACQGPALRSWSCTCAANIVAARFGAMVAAASAVAAATGLRLCGMVEEPPRPSPAGSNASPTSVCIISETSRAILPQVPAMIAITEAASAKRSRWVCQGASGNGRSSSRRELFGDAPAVVRRARPACPPRRRIAAPASRLAAAATARANGSAPRHIRQVSVRTASAAHAAARCARPSRCGDVFAPVAAKPAMARSRSPSSASIAARSVSIAAVSITSWLVAPQCT